MDFYSRYNALADMLQRARQRLDSITPGANGGHIGAVAGAVDPLVSNPLYAPIMGAANGDVLNRHVPRMYGAPGPASPTPPVQSAALPPAGDQNVHPPFSQPSGMPQVATPQPMPQPPQGNNIPWWANAQGANFGGPTPMPQARPAQAPQPAPQPPQPQPQAPQPAPMSFFQRNTAMMRDPATGAFIDPRAAALAMAQLNGNKSS